MEAAGAELVDSDPDVEIGAAASLLGDASCAITELRAPEPRGQSRALRGVKRLAGSAEIRRRVQTAHWAIRDRGYEAPRTMTWERGVTLRRKGEGIPYRRFAHRFPLNAVVVSNGDAGGITAFEAAMAAASAATGMVVDPAELLLGASGVIVAKTDGAVLRVAVGPAARRIEEQVAALSSLEALEPAPMVADRIPWTIAHGKAGLAVWSLERVLPGGTVSARLGQGVLGECLDFLVAIHQIGRDLAPSPGVGDAEVIGTLCGEPVEAAVLRVGERLQDELADLPRGFGHGDFWSGNLLAQDDRLVGVVDWPGASAGRLPLLDLFHLKLSTMRELTGASLGSIVLGRLLPTARAGGDSLDREYCRRVGLTIDSRTSESLVAAYWLQAVAHELLDPDRDPHQAADPDWRRANVEAVLQAFVPAFNGSASSPARAARTRGAAGPAHPVEATILTELSALDAVEDDWRRLAERRGNPFLTPEWFRAWIAYRDDALPYVIATHRADGSLLGVMPFVLSKGGLFPTLSFAGAEFGDLFHPVAERPDEVAVAAATARTLGDHRADWSVIVADYVDDRAPWVSELFIGESMRLATMHYHDHPSLYLNAELTGRTWDEYLSTRSPNFRSQIGRKLRGLQRKHDVAFHQVDSLDELEPRMKVLFNLHERRWRDRGSAVFATDESRAFHLAFARAALNRGWLRLWSLDVDGETVAAWYGWRLGDRYLYYQAGFNPAWSHFSPGLLLLAHTIRAAIEEGASDYDMLLGDEPFKYRFGSVARSAQTLVMTPPLHPARAAVSAEIAIRRLVRRLPPRVHVKVKQFAEPVMQRWSVGAAP